MGQKSKSTKKTKNCKGNPPFRPDKLNTSMNISMNENAQSPSNSNDIRSTSTSTSSPMSGTADMLGQSRQVLYGQQQIHNMNGMQITQPPCLPNVVNNQTPGQPTPVNNTHMLYQYSQPMPLNSSSANPSSVMNNVYHHGQQICVNSYKIYRASWKCKMNGGSQLKTSLLIRVRG